MALTDTPVCDFGRPLPAFSLSDPRGATHSSDALMGPGGLLVAFICNHCPYVIGVADRLAQDLNALQDEYQTESGTVIEADSYHANQLLALSDEQIINKVQRDLATCVPGFTHATVIDSSVLRVPQGVTHFAPGSYQYLLPGKTSIENLFMSGDWIVTRHGSWSQEKAYVTGLEAANLAIDRLGMGRKANIIPTEPDEPHIQVARSLNQMVRDVGKSLLPNFWLP